MSASEQTSEPNCKCTGPWDCQCKDVVDKFYNAQQQPDTDEPLRENYSIDQEGHNEYLIDLYEWKKFNKQKTMDELIDGDHSIHSELIKAQFRIKELESKLLERPAPPQGQLPAESELFKEISIALGHANAHCGGTSVVTQIAIKYSAQLRAELEQTNKWMEHYKDRVNVLAKACDDKDKRIAELETLLRETIYKFEDGQWFPDDLYNKIWNTIRDTNGKA